MKGNVCFVLIDYGHSSPGRFRASSRGFGALGAGALAPVTLPALNDEAPKDLKTPSLPIASPAPSSILPMGVSFPRDHGLG
jgi:hypothetical protein